MGELAEGEGGTSRKSLPLLSRDRLRPAFALQPAPLSLTAAVARDTRKDSGPPKQSLDPEHQAMVAGCSSYGEVAERQRGPKAVMIVLVLSLPDRLHKPAI